MLKELPYPLPRRSPNHALGRSLFTKVRGRVILRSSQARGSPKFVGFTCA